MRNRVEDLGRISVLINLILNLKMMRTLEEISFSIEDYINWFFSLDREAQEKMLIQVVEIQGRIYEILAIADGLDTLNMRICEEQADLPDSMFD